MLQMRLNQVLEYLQSTPDDKAAPPISERGHRPISGRPSPGPEAPRPPQWEDLEISFLSDHRVQVQAGTLRETLTYAEMGFGDLRTGKPTRAWSVLRAFAKHEGRIPMMLGVREWRLIYKRVQEIKARLKERYECQDNPIPFVRGVGYVARFRVTLAPSSKY